jgi:phosphocarrier protein HPr
LSEEVSEGQFQIINARGLHARAATKLVQLAGKFPCDVQLTGPDGQVANGKSVMGVLLLCGAMGTQLRVQATGSKAKDAVEAIGALIAGRFGEAE